MLKRLFASKKRPYFNEPTKWDDLTFDLSGCTFQISLPAQDYEFKEKPIKSHINVFDTDLYHYDTEPHYKGLPPHYKGYMRKSMG